VRLLNFLQLEIFLTNNDVLRRIRYTFNYNDKQMVEIFALADQTVTREQVCSWLKKEDDNEYVNCPDLQLATFLNGFINKNRGKRDGEQPIPEKKLTNNIILTKLKIAFALKAEDIIDLLKLVDLRISKPELSAFFRKVDHKHYRQCKDQILRNFLQGMQEKYYVERSKKIDFNAEKSTNNADANTNKVNTWHADKAQKGNQKQGAKKQASKKQSPNKPVKENKTLYINPKATVQNKENASEIKPSRKVLKLRPEDIWKEND